VINESQPCAARVVKNVILSGKTTVADVDGHTSVTCLSETLVHLLQSTLYLIYVSDISVLAYIRFLNRIEEMNSDANCSDILNLPPLVST
jgi:hypothetical protein